MSFEWRIRQRSHARAAVQRERAECEGRKSEDTFSASRARQRVESGGELLYLSITIKTEMSAGLTPPILDACAKSFGLIFASFCLVSVEICSIFE